MNRSIIKLGGGLNTAASPLGMDPGQVIGSENYECRLDGGYTSIGGFEPQDGRADPAEPTYVVLSAASWGDEAVVGETLTGVDSGATGTIVYVDATHVALINVVGTFEDGEDVYIGAIDPYADEVVLRVIGGSNGSTTIQDQSTYADSTTLSAGGAFSNGQTVFTANMIACTQILPNGTAFSSSGVGSRFTRAPGEAWTIRLYARWNSLPNTAPSGALFAWEGPSTNILTLSFYATAGGIELLNGTTNEGVIATLSADVTHYIQITIQADDSITVDVDGVEEYSGTAASDNTAGTYTFRVANRSTVNATGATYWVTPIDATKGAARPRAVPTASLDLG